MVDIGRGTPQRLLGQESGRFTEAFSIEFEGLTCGKLRNSTLQAALRSTVADLLAVRPPDLRITSVQAGHTPVRRRLLRLAKFARSTIVSFMLLKKTRRPVKELLSNKRLRSHTQHLVDGLQLLAPRSTALNRRPELIHLVSGYYGPVQLRCHGG